MTDPDPTPRHPASPSPPRPPDAPGVCLGGRYTLIRRAAEGGHGEVWEARDELVGRRVAVKRCLALSPEHQLRVRREIEALHLLGIPGVVEIRDHGRDEGGLYLVMGWVDGVHFPKGGWSAIGATALALLRTLVAVHDAGVVHRDIKPANVLVRLDGEPVLVDFGLATGTALMDGLTRVGVAMGTPIYRAPEQVRGEPVDGRADVYALGVMLYQALSGKPPHDAGTEGALIEARMLRPPSPLRGPGLDVPPAVSDVIAAMLRLDPEERWTARQALMALSGERVEAGARLPRLGPAGPVQRVLEALVRGRVVDVGGPPGSGRTRLLEDVAAATGGGLWLARGERPFSSLPFVVRDLDPGLDGEAARAWIAARLAEPGLPVLGDDWALVDPWTRALLEATPPPAGLMRVVAGAAEVVLAPLGWQDLMPLFDGPDRVLHLREDPARLIVQHTGGLPARIDALVRTWVRKGHLEPVGDGRYRARRESLGAMAAEAPLPDGRVTGNLPAPLRDLLGWVCFCAPHSRPEVLRAVAGLAAWEFDLLASALVAQRGARWEGEALIALADAAPSLTEEGHVLAHAAMAEATPVGAVGRLRHLVAAGRLDALTEEALAESAREEAAGRMGSALEVVESAQRLAPAGGRLDGLRIRLLLAQGTADAAQQASFLARSAGDAALAKLAEGVYLARTGKSAEATDILDALLPFASDARLEMVRLANLQTASRNLDVGQQERLLRSIGELPVITEDPINHAQWAGWMGLIRYQRGRFAEAGDLHEQAARGRPFRGRLNSLLNACKSWLEAHELARAEQIATEALALARETRNALQEATAEWVLRSVANRRGATSPDLKLVRCAEVLGDQTTLGLIALTEGFIAWRGRLRTEAATLAVLAEDRFSSVRNRAATAHSAALRFASERVGDSHAIARTALDGRPENALDCLALLAGAGANLEIPKAQLQALAHQIPPEDLPHRCGAYTPAQALAILGLTVP